MNTPSESKPAWFLAASLTVYRVLLGAYPAAFRRRCGRQMEDAFVADWHRARREGGVRGVIVFWSRTMLDLVRTAVPERLGRFASRRIGLRGAVPPGVRPPRRGVAHDLVQDAFDRGVIRSGQSGVLS